jgi:hypothetical protein
LTVLNSYIILHSCGSKLSHRTFDSAWLGISYRREERCLVLRLHHRECQPFPPANGSQTCSALAE